MLNQNNSSIHKLGIVSIHYRWLLPLLVLVTLLILNFVFPGSALAEGSGGGGICPGC